MTPRSLLSLAYVLACVFRVGAFTSSSPRPLQIAVRPGTISTHTTPLSTTARLVDGKIPTPQMRTTTSLAMVAPAGVAVAAITGAMTGGLFAGGLHAIAGPDHLAALLPRCCGQRWYRAGRVGALWGMGHGVSATIIGVAAFGLKNTFKNSMGSRLQTLVAGATHVTEIAVGLSLILIGMMGIREAREWEDELDGVQPQSLSSAAADAGIKTAQKRAVVFNGLLHGFSWDGAPSLAPALAVATWSGNLAFLFSYAVGTMTTMAIATTLIGEGTRKAGDFFDRPDIPQKLSFASSILAIAIGIVWCGLAFL
ncbi:predicted protein [Phaeodactylum tricornutum CCAP 1055/1]|jgi:nickel/cobalt exporter|uniref:Uncharacterized protein n=2 Tax=Phaeodactylum tricornutum TaxID=2850 RepID=B7G7I3_PHATC|nr:predicted protein [Phaeodactylum tricornutum CCAP 1055/1]EEC45241.1 predicted protein [Phaeodactylum tricornutum CCAP 1055/1]|eukprot:XP_002183023.1 predicted protein [Phaeodactylum tricornutum CCAP 1055/1]